MRLIWGSVGVAIILGIAYFVNEDRLAKQRMEQVRWAPIERCADKVVFSEFEKFKYRPTDWNEALEQLATPNAERDLAKRMQKKCDGLVLLDSDAKRVIEKAKAMIEAIPVAAREPCGCAVERPSAWRLQEACWDMRRIEASINLYWLNNFTHPSNEEGFQALISAGHQSESDDRLWIDPWGNRYFYRDGKVFSYGPDGVSESGVSVSILEGTTDIMRSMETEGCF